MGIVESLITFLHIVVSVIIIIAVLLQPGKSGDLGSMFGGGTSESIFGSSGAVPFLAKLTRVLGVVFFATSLCLGYFAVRGDSSSVLKDEGASAIISPGLDGDEDGGIIGTFDIPANPEIEINEVDNPATLDTDNPSTMENNPQELKPSEPGQGEDGGKS